MSGERPSPSTGITVESARGFLPGSFPGDLKIEPLEIEESHSLGRIVVEKRHLHPGGFVHGGVWTALGDTVAAWATFRAIPPGWDFTTIELKLNVFGAGRLGDEIVADARPLHAGRSTAVIEVRIDRIRDGDVVLCELTPAAFKEAGRVKPLGGQSWTAPIVANGKLYVRNKSGLVCLDLNP